MCEQLILGCDVLSSAIIDLGRGVVTIHGKTWPIYHTKKRNTQVGIIMPATRNTVFNKLIRDNHDLFSSPNKQLGTCKYIPMTISTTGPPISQRAYRAPLLKRQLISDCIDDMLAQNINRPSVSSWASPVTIVPKPDGSPRFCIDYRKLNSVTTPDQHPLPNMAEIVDLIGQAKVFSTLDLKSGYWQIAIDEASIPKTAFRCHRDLYEFRRLPFGLRNAPASFQRIMDSVLGDLIGKNCLLYLDDIFVFSDNAEEHLGHIQSVFERLRTAGFTLNSEKCHFGLSEVKMLGFIINGQGIATDPAKVEVIKNLPAPRSVKQIRSFVGSCSFYRRMLPSFSHHAEALTKLTRKHVKFVWGPEQETAFVKLKALLVSSKVMAVPRPEEPYLVYTDASDYAVGAILVQKDETGTERVIQYVSHSLSKSQRKWSVLEREGWAIIHAIRTLRPYLYGAKYTIYCDHKPLKSLFTKQMNNTRVQRWGILLAESGAEIKYLPGKLNGRADMCSRIVTPLPISVIDADADWIDPLAFPEQDIAETLPLEHDGLNLAEIGKQQRIDFPNERRKATIPGSNYILIKDVIYNTKRPYIHAPEIPRLLLPQKLINQVIDRAHKEVGHLSHATVIP